MGYLFSGMLSSRGREITRVFGVREEQAGKYETHLYVDAESLAPDVVREVVECIRAAVFAPEWIGEGGSYPWIAFRVDFDDGRSLQCGSHDDGPDEDGFLHFHRDGDFVGPPCPMTCSRFYRLFHPTVEEAKEAERARQRDAYPRWAPPRAIPYPDPPPGSEAWSAQDSRWREIFDGFLARDRARSRPR